MKKTLLSLSLLLSFTVSQANESVNVAIAAEPYPPFSTKQADGKWEGFEIDLLKKVCDDAKLDCKIKEIAWDGLIPALLSNKVDFIFNSVTVTDERAKKVLFTTTYYNTLPAIVGAKGQTFKINKETLKNKIIGVQKSTIASTYIKEKAGKITTLRYYDTQDQVNSDLLAGRIDFMIADDIPATDFYKKNKETAKHYGTVEYEPSLGKGVAAAVRLDDKDLANKLNKVITPIISSDFYKDLSMKYFGTNIAP